jgi:hypothetical protein
VTPDPTARHEQRQAPHQREPDPQEGEDRPLEAKDTPPTDDPNRDPHAPLNNPVGEPDPAATADPFDDDPQSQGDVEET